MHFNKEGPIDPQLFKMCKDAHKYQESFKMDSLISEMSQMTLNEPDLFKMAEEIGNYFDMVCLNQSKTHTSKNTVRTRKNV
jgi:hypothetical protein